MSDNYGAFVEIDHNATSRETLFLLGAREAIDRWITKLQRLSGEQPNLGVGQVMREVCDAMIEDRDGIAVALTRQALKDKSGRLEKIRKD